MDFPTQNPLWESWHYGNTPEYKKNDNEKGIIYKDAYCSLLL